MVVLTTSARDAPAAARTADRFLSACSVWASIPSAACPVCGSMPAVPEQNTKPPATIAWLYGPSAAGACSLDTACRVMVHLSGHGDGHSWWSPREDGPPAGRAGAGAPLREWPAADERP